MNNNILNIAVGEMGISPTEAEKLTEEELAIAYKGFINNKINNANLLLLVLKKDKQNNYTPISSSSSVNSITPEERNEILKMLGAYQNGNQNNQINGEKDNSSPFKN